MRRERVLKAVLVVLGLLFCAGVYPLVLMAKEEPALAKRPKSSEVVRSTRYDAWRRMEDSPPRLMLSMPCGRMIPM
jgi:hypothetical protein